MRILQDQNELPEGHLSLEAGAQLNSIRIVLSDQGAALRGVLRQPAGESLAAGGWVAVAPVEAERREVPGLSRTVRADHRGYYAIEGIAPGRYFVLAYRNPKSLPPNPAALDSWAAERRYHLPVVEFKAATQERIELRTVD